MWTLAYIPRSFYCALTHPLILQCGNILFQLWAVESASAWWCSKVSFRLSRLPHILFNIVILRYKESCFFLKMQLLEQWSPTFLGPWAGWGEWAPCMEGVTRPPCECDTPTVSMTCPHMSVTAHCKRDMPPCYRDTPTACVCMGWRSISAAQFWQAHGPALGHGPGVDNPCSRVVQPVW